MEYIHFKPTFEVQNSDDLKRLEERLKIIDDTINTNPEQLEVSISGNKNLTTVRPIHKPFREITISDIQLKYLQSKVTIHQDALTLCRDSYEFIIFYNPHDSKPSKSA